MATGYGLGLYGEGPYGIGATAVPTLTDVATALGKDPEAIAVHYYAEVLSQAQACRVEPYADDLASALIRRVRRAQALEALALGIIQDEAGSIRVGFTDGEIRRLEAPHRRLALG